MKDAIEVSIIFHEGQRMFAVPKQPAPVQDLPFGVGGGLVAIKTLLSRDPCVHANTAIEMIDAILKEHPAAQRQWVGLTDEEIIEWVESGEYNVITNDWASHIEFARAIEAKLCEKNAAQPAVPDALNPKDENPAYAAGWNDCRQAMMEMMK